jgi:hypothetical protein
MLTGSRSLFLMVLCLLTTGLVNASTPSEHRASQLAIGEWDIVLKCSRDIYESVLFPHVKAREPSALVPRLKDIAPQVYPCRLCIFANSTFCLEPRDTGGWYRQSFQDPHLNSIRGKWKAKPNPYCATDRYFDEIMLSSLSRVERQLPKKVGPWPWARKNEMLLKKIKFHLSCRLYGQFWDSSRSTGHILDGNEKYVRGRMSHGVLVTDQMDGADKPSEWWRKRVIAGSFAGRRRRQVIDIDDEPNQKGKAEKSR